MCRLFWTRAPYVDSQGRWPRVLVSRPDTVERLGRARPRGVETRVLQSAADVADTQGLGGESERHWGSRPPRETVPWEQGRTAHLVTGSANCTTAAFSGNIEVSVHLMGPTATCGPSALFGDIDQGFLRLTQPYESSSDDAQPDPTWVTERAVETWHAALAAASPTLHVRSEEREDTFTLSLEIGLPEDPGGFAAHTTVAPVAAKHANPRPLAHLSGWAGLSLVSLAPYLTVTTEVPDAGVTASCVIVCDVVGAPSDRLTQLLKQVLSTPEDVLRYLVLLLGDPSLAAMLDRLLGGQDSSEETDSGHASRRGSFDDLVLLEPLLRAAARNDDSLDRARRLLEDLDSADGGAVSDDFRSLWSAVREAVVS